MIDIYSTNVTASTGMTVPLNTKSVQRGYSATVSSDGTEIYLNTSGVYEVNVSAYGSTTAAGSFGFQVQGNGAGIDRATISSATTAGDDVAVSMSTLIVVNNALATDKAALSIEYTGDAGTIQLINVTVKRVA